ncbi:MAG: site-2 protease family protein [Promethearchaeota archaeon]
MPFLNSPILDFLLHPWVLISIIFWGGVLLLVFLLRKRKGAAILFFPLLAMFRTKRLNKFIIKISRKNPKFWRVFWTIGIFVSFAFTIYAFYYFFTNLINLIIDPKIEQAVILLIPGVTVDLTIFMYMILPLVFIITTHEFAHGIAAGSDGLDVKSTGVLGAGLFFIIGFGAFVEIDERKASSSKVSRYTRLRIASAGTYVNGITAGIAFILVLSFPLMTSPTYRQVTQVDFVLPEEFGGFNSGNLTVGDAILAIKKQGTADSNYVHLDEFKGISLSYIFNNNTALQFSPQDNITLRTYVPSSDSILERNVTLGPRYYLGIYYRYTANRSALEITRIFSASEGGNNYDKGLTTGLIIESINGIPINISNGDTLEKALANFNLNTINFSSSSSTWVLDVETIGVVIGVYTSPYYMYKNDVGKFLTNEWPEFVLLELGLLFAIALTITLFNMLPLPIFDGDRLVKELINWGIGEEYMSVKKKKDKLYYKPDEKKYGLSEYRVEGINSVEIIIEDKSRSTEPSIITLAEDKYELIDDIGDGFRDTLSLDLPEQTKIEEGAKIEISYDYQYDEKRKIKRTILNSLRAITLVIMAGNFIISFIKFGAVFFWL